MKKNFYLQHSLVATHDPRMKALMEEEGFEGLGAYWFIIEKLELLPEPCAQLDYLKPLCSKKNSPAIPRKNNRQIPTLHHRRRGLFHALGGN